MISRSKTSKVKGIKTKSSLHGMKVLLFISPVPRLRKNMHDDQRLPGAVGAKWVLVGSA